ncbi:septal ring lytic transglycosylase RlpA family protein [Shivajiella indica]|uniref:Probable endolytic peptidoglycan transglycosylase RlpA n=1 Tax=Shivajiella indica TaxID=872115 RepID=A0ABW5B7W5_9BACT
MKSISLIIFLLFQIPAWAGNNEPSASSEERLKIQEGIASFYGKRFHLRKTANGEIFNMQEMTAAHKYLPFGTMLKVTNQKNGKEVWVRINDRLPQTSKRIIDLSRGAAQELDMIRDGIVPVKLEVSDEEIVFSLIDHFKENKPEDLRLRYYESAIEMEKPSIIGLPAEICVIGNMLASTLNN